MMNDQVFDSQENLTDGFAKKRRETEVYRNVRYGFFKIPEGPVAAAHCAICCKTIEAISAIIICGRLMHLSCYVEEKRRAR